MALYIIHDTLVFMSDLYILSRASVCVSLSCTELGDVILINEQVRACMICIIRIMLI